MSSLDILNIKDSMLLLQFIKTSQDNNKGILFIKIYALLCHDENSFKIS